MSGFFFSGGPLMWPLAGCSAVLLAYLFERAWTASSPRWRESSEERAKHRRILPFFIEVAPAIGLLGTMQGIMECFNVLGGASPGRDALAGLGVAAITTVYGLVIALVATIAMFALDALARGEDHGVPK
jgi:biopolymer transport protein ExbB/TolQ